MVTKNNLALKKLQRYFYLFYPFKKIDITGEVYPIAIYNTSTHSCDLFRNHMAEGLNCTTASDCLYLNLNCDLVTNTCKREVYCSCLVDSDCLSSLKCINNFCTCVSFFSRFISF